MMNRGDFDSTQASDNRCAFDDKLVIKPSLVAGSTTTWSYKAVRTIAVHTNVQLTAVLLYRRLTAFLLLQRCCISCPPLLQLLLALADLTWLAYTDFPGTQYQPHNACSGQTAGHVKLLCATWTCDWAGAPPTRAAFNQNRTRVYYEVATISLHCVYHPQQLQLEVF